MIDDPAGNRVVIIVEVELPASRVVLLQSLLYGEDGLAVMRCLDPARRVQQLWTTPSMLAELHDWLAGLPESLGVRIVGEKQWSGERHG